jgi:hypothetical protein
MLFVGESGNFLKIVLRLEIGSGTEKKNDADTTQ